MKIDQDSAKIRIPPPLILLFCVAVGWGVNQLYPFPISSWGQMSVVGYLTIFLGLSTILYAKALFKKFETNIKPWKTTSKIIKSSLYSYSRNPIYICFCVIGIGFALVLNSVWVILLVIVYALILTEWVIKKEENYLQKKFGTEYTDYKSQVRRWI
jgi:protein-S-isoprenylcysteine O-methyltransferase Ste14